MVGLEVFRDKWAVPEAELITRATTYVNRWKDGRRVVAFSAAMKLIPYEAGDVVTFSALQMPPHDNGALDYILIRRDLNWLDQKLSLILLEK